MENSVRDRYVSKYYNKKKYESNNWLAMKEKGKKYYPFFKDLEYVESKFANRPIPIVDVNDDRSTKIVKHEFPIGLYSIKEGKFTSAVMIAKKFVHSLNMVEV